MESTGKLCSGPVGKSSPLSEVKPLASKARLRPSCRVSLPSPKQQFRFKNHRLGTLITPNGNKYRWREDEKVFRSLWIDPDGYILSAAWPKFGNYGEVGFEAESQALSQAFTQESTDDLWITEKIDGTLVIRSVIEGKVVFRTRGTFDGGIFLPAIEKVVRENYPCLLDPSIWPNCSLLFEFISSDPYLKVVYSHDQDDLIFLGGVNHHDLSLISNSLITSIAQSYQLRLVASVEPPRTIRELAQSVKSWKKSEGVVARTGQTLVKIKSASYLALHRIRCNLTVEALRQLCVAKNLTTIDDFKYHIQNQGGDWESFQDAQMIIETILRTRQYAKERIEPLDNEIDMICLKAKSRKEQICEIRTLLNESEQDAAILLLDGKFNQAGPVLEKHLLDAALTSYQDQDQDRG